MRHSCPTSSPSRSRTRVKTTTSTPSSTRGIPEKSRAKIRFELIKTVDSYDAFFTQWSLSLSDEGDEILKKQIYDIAYDEHDRKMRMLADIIRLKIQVLVAEYGRRRW